MRMLSKRVKVDTMNLEPGMFVALLDRPWLETPFLLQGFEIREDSEIGLLRKFCKHVYVDVDRSSVPKARVMEAHASGSRNRDPFAGGQGLSRLNGRKPATLVHRLLAIVSRFDPTGRLADKLNRARQYENQVATTEEAPRAAHAYGIAIHAMNEVVDELRKGSGIQVDKVKGAVAPMIDSMLRNQDAMAWLATLRKRDDYAYHHSIATAVWSLLLGRHLGFDRNGLQTLAMGGVLLDIGKAAIPESITGKEGPLTDEETEIMQAHVHYGERLVRKTPGISEEILDMIRSHHERHDGSGYPNGIAGSEIPVYGRIAGLVDCFDAMISRRPWAEEKSAYDAVRELNLLSGTQFQRELVEQFVQALGMFPTGTVVELNTGEVGVVIEQNRVRRLRPKLMIVLDRHHRPLPARHVMDLNGLPSNETDRRSRWIDRGHAPAAFGLELDEFFQ
jgi:HD-GYP domain-containing protein (c-di-GMP phosphodiesterase class II)